MFARSKFRLQPMFQVFRLATLLSRYFFWQRCFRETASFLGRSRGSYRLFQKFWIKTSSTESQERKKNFFQKQIFDPRFFNEEKNLREMKQKGNFHPQRFLIKFKEVNFVECKQGS